MQRVRDDIQELCRGLLRALIVASLIYQGVVGSAHLAFVAAAPAAALAIIRLRDRCCCQWRTSTRPACAPPNLVTGRMTNGRRIASRKLRTAARRLASDTPQPIKTI